MNPRIPLLLVLVAAATGCGASASAAAPSAVAPVSADLAPQYASPEADVQPMAASVQSESSHPAPRNVSQAGPMAPPQSVQTARPIAAKTAAIDGKKPDSGNDAQAADFLIMYTGDLGMSVDDGKIATTIDKIIDVSESVGGHLAGRRDLSVSIRVPSARFREAFGKISALGDVTHQSVQAEDVSEEFHDAEVRLQNLKSARQRLQEFLAKSGSMADMLTLEHELERVSMDIDRIEGRMRYLREHVAFSTLTIALTARPRTGNIVAGDGKPIPASRVMHLDAAWIDNMGVPNLVQ